MKSARSKPQARLCCRPVRSTPKTLMLSGIGDRAELDRLGIATVSHLSGVGRNFQDHLIIGAGLWEAPGPLPTGRNAAEANLYRKEQSGTQYA
jgi:choline dehydrogenase